jgi:hypothetical protein
LNEYRGGSVTFGDRKRSQIKGNGSIEIKGLSGLCEVLYVKDLKATFSVISSMKEETGLWVVKELLTIAMALDKTFL